MLFVLLIIFLKQLHNQFEQIFKLFYNRFDTFTISWTVKKTSSLQKWFEDILLFMKNPARIIIEETSKKAAGILLLLRLK